MTWLPNLPLTLNLVKARAPSLISSILTRSRHGAYSFVLLYPHRGRSYSSPFCSLAVPLVFRAHPARCHTSSAMSFGFRFHGAVRPAPRSVAHLYSRYRGYRGESRRVRFPVKAHPALLVMHVEVKERTTLTLGLKSKKGVPWPPSDRQRLCP